MMSFLFEHGKEHHATSLYLSSVLSLSLLFMMICMMMTIKHNQINVYVY